VAAEVQLHNMSVDNGVMRMRQVEGGIAVPANGSLQLRPGSYHIMFMGLKRQLRQGERFPVTLRFQRAGSVTVQFAVQPVTSTGPMENAHAGR
jgi:copper(I)-binding protein